jgi:hypothetical protein
VCIAKALLAYNTTSHIELGRRIYDVVKQFFTADFALKLGDFEQFSTPLNHGFPNDSYFYEVPVAQLKIFIFNLNLHLNSVESE